MANITETCKECGKKFLIIDQEQKFLQDKELAFPTKCATCRQKRRLKLRGERELFRTKCAKCGKEIIVSYNPKTVTNQILCNKDYEQYFVQNDAIITDPLPEA